MNLFKYKLKLTFFISLTVFLIIFLTGTSFFAYHFYRNYLHIQSKLNHAKQYILNINSNKFEKLLFDLNDAEITQTLGTIVSNNPNKNNITHKFLFVHYAVIKNNYGDVLYENFDISKCGKEYICKFFKKDNLELIFGEKIDSLNNIVYDIFIFSVFAFIITLFLSFGVYMSINYITKPVEENIEFMKNFVNNAGHELKTPLANINLSAQILQQKKVYDEEIIEDIVQESSKLSQLIDSLLNLSILNKTENKENIDIDLLLKNIILRYEDKINKKNIKINISLSDKFIYANKNHLEILLNNLVNNAIKYNVNNGFIDIKLEKKQLIIRNTGSTIPKDKIKKIFDIFYRLDNKKNGYGLGLSIVKKIIEINNWRITVESENGINTFKILF